MQGLKQERPNGGFSRRAIKEIGFNDEAAMNLCIFEGGIAAQTKVRKAREQVYVNSPLVMIITMSQRVVLATYIHHDVTRSQFFRVPSPHNFCILYT